MIALVPHALTAARAASAPGLAALLATGRAPAALLLLALAAASDALDGRLARSLGVASGGGGWFDAGADLAVLLAGYGGLVTAGLVPWWVAALPAFVFGCFVLTSVLTSGPSRPVYDAVGRWFAPYAWAGLGVLVALPDPALVAALTGGLLAASVGTIVVRVQARLARSLFAPRSGPLRACPRCRRRSCRLDRVAAPGGASLRPWPGTSSSRSSARATRTPGSSSARPSWRARRTPMPRCGSRWRW